MNCCVLTNYTISKNKVPINLFRRKNWGITLCGNCLLEVRHRSHVKESNYGVGHYVRDWHNRPNGRRVFPYELGIVEA